VAARIASSVPHARVTLLEKNANVGGRCGSFWVEENLAGEDGNHEGLPSCASARARIVASLPPGDAPMTSLQTTTTTTTRKRYFRHERGPSLLLLPEVYRQIFVEATSPKSRAGPRKTAEDYGLKMLQCVPAYQVIFEDGDCLSVGFPAKVVEEEDTGTVDPAREEKERESRTKMDSYERNGAAKWDRYMAITAAYLDCGFPNFIEERLDLGSFPNFFGPIVQGFWKGERNA
jgi:hypothetical protein